MNDDIIFYDFEFNILHILPPYTNQTGYSSADATIELNNSGSFELLFCDEELTSLIEEHKDTMLVVWRDFQGFITGYNFNTKHRLFGMSLNGLLHRIVLPPCNETTGTAEDLAMSALQNISWLNMGSKKGFTNEVTYQTNTYMTADEYIQGLMALDNAGYSVRADIKNKRFIFECIQPVENELILSENNLNAYEFETNYNNKSLAFGGWYNEKQQNDNEGNIVEPIWKYITLDDTKKGIYVIDTVLKAETATEAQNELKTYKAEYELSAKTRNVYHNIDYYIGDIIRIQKGNKTVKKIVSGVNMWNEIVYGEQPILNESEVI